MINTIKPYSVYVIDDDPIFQFTIKKLLSLINPDIHVNNFKNGQDALDCLQPDNKILTRPNLIILDINMPVLNGWRFLQELEKMIDLKSLAAPVIYLVSCVLYQDDWRRAKNSALVKDFIMKPISGEKLQSMMDTTDIYQNSNRIAE